jgi:hypothetical protein
VYLFFFKLFSTMSRAVLLGLLGTLLVELFDQRTISLFMTALDPEFWDSWLNT